MLWRSSRQKQQQDRLLHKIRRNSKYMLPNQLVCAFQLVVNLTIFAFLYREGFVAWTLCKDNDKRRQVAVVHVKSQQLFETFGREKGCVVELEPRWEPISTTRAQAEEKTRASLHQNFFFVYNCRNLTVISKFSLDPLSKQNKVASFGRRASCIGELIERNQSECIYTGGDKPGQLGEFLNRETIKRPEASSNRSDPSAGDVFPFFQCVNSLLQQWDHKRKVVWRIVQRVRPGSLCTTNILPARKHFREKSADWSFEVSHWLSKCSFGIVLEQPPFTSPSSFCRFFNQKIRSVGVTRTRRTYNVAFKCNSPVLEESTTNFQSNIDSETSGSFLRWKFERADKPKHLVYFLRTLSEGGVASESYGLRVRFVATERGAKTPQWLKHTSVRFSSHHLNFGAMWFATRELTRVLLLILPFGVIQLALRMLKFMTRNWLWTWFEPSDIVLALIPVNSFMTSAVNPHH